MSGRSGRSVTPVASPEPEKLPYKTSVPREMVDQALFRWSGSGMAHKDKSVMLKRDVEYLPSLDQAAYYDKYTPFRYDKWDADDFVEVPAGPSRPNAHHKLDPDAQFMRRNKLAAWTPFYEDVQTDRHARKRLSACLEQFMPAAAADVGAELPLNVSFDIDSRKKRKTDKALHDSYILPHLRSPSPPRSTEELAPMLAIPETYIDVMVSPSMRHALGDDAVEQGLQRTASELLEGEKPLMQALGRMRDMLRLRMSDVKPLLKPRWEKGRGGLGDRSKCWPADPTAPKQIDDLPVRHDTDNLWRMTQDLIEKDKSSVFEYTLTDPRRIPAESVADWNNVDVTPVQALFVVPDGITLKASNPDMPNSVREYNIKLADQKQAVDGAMERLAELISDCNEYKVRLEEARDRVADVARARKKVWSVIKARAAVELDKLEEKEMQGRQ